MPRITHFEINADDVQRAVGFYKNVFNWEVEKWDGPVEYWFLKTGEDDEPGINGAIQPREDPRISVVNTMDVENLDDYLEKIIQAGGKIQTPKSPIPGIGYFAQCFDTEGNLFGLMESDPSAQ